MIVWDKLKVTNSTNSITISPENNKIICGTSTLRFCGLDDSRLSLNNIYNLDAGVLDVATINVVGSRIVLNPQLSLGNGNTLLTGDKIQITQGSYNASISPTDLSVNVIRAGTMSAVGVTVTDTTHTATLAPDSLTVSEITADAINVSNHIDITGTISSSSRPASAIHANSFKYDATTTRGRVYVTVELRAGAFQYDRLGIYNFGETQDFTIYLRTHTEQTGKNVTYTFASVSGSGGRKAYAQSTWLEDNLDEITVNGQSVHEDTSFGIEGLKVYYYDYTTAKRMRGSLVFSEQFIFGSFDDAYWCEHPSYLNLVMGRMTYTIGGTDVEVYVPHVVRNYN